MDKERRIPIMCMECGTPQSISQEAYDKVTERKFVLKEKNVEIPCGSCHGSCFRYDMNSATPEPKERHPLFIRPKRLN